MYNGELKIYLNSTEINRLIFKNYVYVEHLEYYNPR